MSDSGTLAAGRGDRLRLRARMAWRLGVQRRLHAVDALDRALPWPAWRVACGVNAATLVDALGRRADPPVRSFVQVGSNDGVQSDPLHASIRRNGWQGLLVEPVPAIFDRLVANYAGSEHVQFANVAVAPEPGIATIYAVEPQPGDPPWVSLIASLDREVLLRHRGSIPHLDERIHAHDVETVPLAALLERHGITSVDLLHVDAEGLDDEIVRQIDADAPWAPRFVVFERKHLSPQRYRAVRRWLRTRNYRVADLWPDVFAYRSRPW